MLTVQKQKIKLTQKDITWNEDKTWISAVERTPESDNSTMNIYVYPTESSRNISDYPLGIIAYYNMPGARLMKKTQNAMKIYGSRGYIRLYCFFTVHLWRKTIKTVFNRDEYIDIEYYIIIVNICSYDSVMNNAELKSE